MSATATDELLGLLAMLLRAQPEVRLGQMVAALALVSRGDQAGAVWEIEDDELAEAARWQLGQLGLGAGPDAEPGAAADTRRALAFPGA